MKTLFIIRLVAASVLATLASIGWAAVVPGSGVLLFVSGLLLISYGELTRPIPRNEWWWTFPLIGLLLAVLLLSPFLRWPPAPGKTMRIAIAVLGWIFCMWAIYRRWQSAKGQVDA